MMVAIGLSFGSQLVAVLVALNITKHNKVQKDYYILIFIRSFIYSFLFYKWIKSNRGDF